MSPLGSWSLLENVLSLTVPRSRSSVPVPEVFGYDVDPSNESGAPYMFLEYIHGTTASDFRWEVDSGPGLYGTPEQHARFLDQLARIQAETATFTFDRIGSLCWSEETSSFFIDPDMETGKGPWASAAEYYRDYAGHLLERAATSGPSSLMDRPSFALPLLLDHLLERHAAEATGGEAAGRFRLVNMDLGAHNTLVDAEFNIVGVVDFDAVVALPLDAAAQNPVLTGLAIEPPGFRTERPAVRERIEQSRKHIQWYRECIAKHEASLGDGTSPLADRMDSTAALAYYGMRRYASHMGEWNATWYSWAMDVLRGRTPNGEMPPSEKGAM